MSRVGRTRRVTAAWQKSHSSQMAEKKEMAMKQMAEKQMGEKKQTEKSHSSAMAEKQQTAEKKQMEKKQMEKEQMEKEQMEKKQMAMKQVEKNKRTAAAACPSTRSAPRHRPCHAGSHDRRRVCWRHRRRGRPPSRRDRLQLRPRSMERGP